MKVVENSSEQITYVADDTIDPELVDSTETGTDNEDLEEKKQKYEKHRATEHEILEKMHQESTGSKVY